MLDNSDKSVHQLYGTIQINYYLIEHEKNEYLVYGICHTKYNLLLQTKKLLKQGFLAVKLKPALRKFYGRHNDFVNRYGMPVS